MALKMNKWNENTKRRIAQLETVKRIAEAVYRTSPRGQLSIVRCNGRVSYYVRLKPTDKKGRYLSKTKDSELIRKLAQKKYCAAVIKSIDAELAAIRRFIKNCPEVRAEDVHKTAGNEYRALIAPLFEDDETALNNWNKKEFVSLNAEKGKCYQLSENEAVRSKSEWIILTILKEEGIPYKYEKRLLIGGNELYPDFTFFDANTRSEIYWEHFGMMNDAKYADAAIKKLHLYMRAGIADEGRLIFTMESTTSPLDINDIRDIVCRLKERVKIKDAV